MNTVSEFLLTLPSERKRNCFMKRLILTILSIFAIAFGGMAEGTMKTHERIAENGYPFWIYTPDGYDGTKAQPIVVFLHGRSLCGRNLNQVLRYGTLDAIKKGMNMPAFVIAPQNPGEAWKPSKLMDIIEWMEANYKVDANRIYVLGMSLGGYGTMDFAGTYPDKIAAAMALCGGCYLKDQTGLGELPFWIIHGTADRAVGVNESKKVVAGLQEKQLTSRLHGALARAFYLKDTYDWLFAHSLQDEGRPVEEYISIDNAILKMAYSELRELRALVGEDD